MSGIPLQLSAIRPDFEALVMQLQVYLNSKSTWSDLLTSSTGETLIEMMAAVGAFNQFAIESAAREGFLSTAVRESSIYAIARMLGVRISRKAPASAKCDLVRSSDPSVPLAIKKFTQFTVNGGSFFNRDTIFFDAGSISSTDVVLFQGDVRVETFAADSVSFKEIYLNEPGFVISNFDLMVEMVSPATGEAVLWEPINEGIWNAEATDRVYYDSTSGLGEVVLAFGDGYHGALPSIGTTIRITYAITNGAIGNNGGSNLEVRVNTIPSIIGKTLTGITGGADEKPANYYKSLAPHLYKARTRAVTPQDYRAIVTSYPNVASCAVQAQKDIAPGDLRWMNVVRICILPADVTSDAFTADQWAEFLTWFKKTSHAAIQIQTYNPLKLTRDISITLALKSTAIAGEIVPIVDTNIRSLFTRGLATLGKRIAISDIIGAATVTGVDYVDVHSPTSDMTPPENVLKQLHYFELGNLSIGAQYSERVYYNNTSTVK